MKLSAGHGIQYTAVKQGVGAPLRTVTVRDTVGDLPPLKNGADVCEMPYSGIIFRLQPAAVCFCCNPLSKGFHSPNHKAHSSEVGFVSRAQSLQ